jgi:polar amino acid transport system permease protein
VFGCSRPSFEWVEKASANGAFHFLELYKKMPESLAAIADALPYLLRGSFVTIAVVIGAMSLGFAVGLPLAVGQVYGGAVTRSVVGVYIWFFRGIPLLVFLFLFYFGFCTALEIDIPPFTVAVIVLGLISSAYQSQIFRGAILSLPEGQLKAARALGMSELTGITFIIIPQALRLSIPGWSNEYSILLKDSAVTYALGVAEIMARTHFVATRTYQHLPLYLSAGIIFLLLTWLGTKGLRLLEEKVRIPGYSHHLS